MQTTTSNKIRTTIIFDLNRLSHCKEQNPTLATSHAITRIGKFLLFICTEVSLFDFQRFEIGVFTVCPQYGTANIANFVLAMPFKMKKTDKVCNRETQSSLPVDVYFHITNSMW